MLFMLASSMAADPNDVTHDDVFNFLHPPEHGKFFYVDFPQHDKYHGQHAIITNIRNRDHDGWDSYPLYFTTQQ
jgi:hypothetical protein